MITNFRKFERSLNEKLNSIKATDEDDEPMAGVKIIRKQAKNFTSLSMDKALVLVRMLEGGLDLMGKSAQDLVEVEKKSGLKLGDFLNLYVACMGSKEAVQSVKNVYAEGKGMTWKQLVMDTVKESVDVNEKEDAMFKNIGTDEDGNAIGNCKVCGSHGVMISEHNCKKK